MIKNIAKLIIISLLITSCGKSNKIECNQLIANSREILSSSISLTPVWSIQGIPMENFLGNSLIASDNDSIFIASSACDRVFALDWDNGDILWTSPQSIANNISRLQPSHITLDTNRNRLYISATRRLFALDSLSGNVLWTNTSTELRHNGHRTILDEEGNVFFEEHNIFLIDPSTGNLTLATSDFLPVINDFQINSQNNIISNIVIHNNVIYFLDTSATLHIQNIDSDVLQTIQFDLSQYVQLDASWITVKENYIALYFQDTDILSVYEWSN